ncbi:MAG: class I tRNA ligase family protein, partial [Oscillospiraceae bacterium]|nr:class I tRNA ligase family protein [Oscillospiraceae bacterium]
YYCEDCGEVMVSKEDVHVCSKCGSTHVHQDPDTLDTWFSSALWPFSTLGWPNNTEELKYFYPTSTLVTGYDIIFFWVIRMVFSSLEHMGQVPFNTVLFHGLVRDAQGRKMSKSLGNGIDPLEIIDQYGADALRFALANGNTPGNDMRFSDDKVLASRNFANKLWNAARFILMNITDENMKVAVPAELAIEDKWVLSKYNSLVKDVTDNLEKFELGIALGKVYDFIWDVFCDWYVELTKTRLWEGGEAADPARQVLVYLMDGILKLLHPFMPFITEEIWQAIPHEGESIMVSNWPVYKEELNFSAEEQEFEKVMDAIKAVRARRSEMNVPPSKKATLHIETASEEVFRQGQAFLERLAWADAVDFSKDFDADSCVQVITSSARIFIPLAQLVDHEKEIARLNKEKADCEKDIKFLSGKLNNPGFVAKAPEKVIAVEREKLAKAEERMAKILESLKSFE